MKGKWLPILLLVLFAISRIPGLFPTNLSAAYAIVFCAGVYITGAAAWWAPLLTLLVTDLGLNMYYAHKGWPVWNLTTLGYQLFNYLAYIAIIGLGRRFKPKSSFPGLVGGGVLGGLIFYLLTNFASWLFNPFENPEYSKSLLGLLLALTKGTSGWPDAWLFLRNTLLGAGIFTALFVALMKLTAPAESPAEKTAGVRDEEPASEGEAEPEEAKA